MKKLLMTLTISVIASIMIIGALIASPDAYSSKSTDVDDECKCDKPDTLIVNFATPLGEIESEFRFEIFKNLKDRDEPGKLLWAVPGLFKNGDPLTVAAVMFAKDKLESNTAFVVYKVVEGPADELVALMQIHTSCSKPLFKDMIVDDSEFTNNGYSLKVVDGLLGGDSSIPIADASICEDEKKKSTGSITVKKALTNDNGGTAKVEDFKITVTNVDDTPFDLVPDMMDPSISTIDVPAGTYKLSETELDGYTTVLIAGDTGCPSTVNEPFTIKKNKNLSCTIYNDDNFDASTGGPGGIVFQNNSLQILIDAIPGVDDTYDSCDSVDQEGKLVNRVPCIQIVDSQNIAIVDPALGENTNTIVLFSVVEDVIDSVDGAKNPSCLFETLIPHGHSFVQATNPTNNIVVLLSCPGIETDEVINVNYVMIDPTM